MSFLDVIILLVKCLVLALATTTMFAYFKLFVKEDITPVMADKWVYLISPAFAVIPALIIWATIPLACWPSGGDGVVPIGGCAPAGGSNFLQLAEFNVGILYLLAVTSIGV